MAQSFISEIGDRLGYDGVANTNGEHVKTISAEYYKRNDDSTVSNARIQDALDGKAALTHSHGNITSDGKVGTAASKPLITTTGGAVTTGSFGTSENTFCQGNDSRLSDARTPTAHASTSTTYGVGSSTNYGHVKLYDNVIGSNTDGAPTQKAVKEAIAAVEGGKVKATAKSDNVNYKLLATASDSPTSGALTEAVYGTDITLNPSANTINASLARTFSGSTVSETPIITVSGSTDGFKLTYGSETADLGITKLYTTDDANAKLSFGNMVSSTYKEALVITNGSANLTGTVNGYTIGKSVPSDAVFTDTTYTANNGVSLSGTTFSNSGVRSATINGNYLRVNTGGTNADLTIPYATKAGSADKLTMPSSGSNAITGVESSGGYLTQAYSNTGYPETYGNVLTVGGKGGSQLFMGWSGSTQGISKVYYRNRHDVATTSGECWSDWKAFAWSDHKHSGSDITSGTVGVSYGGTGKSSVTADNFLVGNGTSALVEKTPTEVRSLIGAGTSSLTIGTSSTTAAAGNHTHGNITSDGKLQSSDVTIASGDKIVVTDSSNSNKVARTSLSFDGSTTSQALTKKGTFETFAKITWIDSIPANPVIGMIYAI